MTPYGYKIVRGEALVDSEQALNIRTFFRLYLEGFTIDDAGHDAGIPKGRMATGMILSNPIYLGDGFLPADYSGCRFPGSAGGESEEESHARES